MLAGSVAVTVPALSHLIVLVGDCEEEDNSSEISKYFEDIIALDGDVLVFVEVKTRRNRIFGDPVDAVGYQKIRNLQQAANHYVKYRCINRDIRFDIICITGTAGSEADIEHIEDAF